MISINIHIDVIIVTVNIVIMAQGLQAKIS